MTKLLILLLALTISTPVWAEDCKEICKDECINGYANGCHRATCIQLCEIKQILKELVKK